MIEVPKEISNTKYMISTKEIKYHSHIVLKTDIPVIELLKSFKCFFNELKTYPDPFHTHKIALIFMRFFRVNF